MARSILLTPILLVLISQVVFAGTSIQDVDLRGNGQKAHFKYTLVRMRHGFRATVRVTDPAHRELWSHQWTMTAADLHVLMREEGRNSVSRWIKNFFRNQPFATPTISRKKLTEADLAPDYLADAAKELHVSSRDLKQAILRQKENVLFIYRASWREDLVALVYVPQYNRFIAYAGYGH